MKIGKLVWFNILAFLLMLNTAFLYFAGGLEAYTFTKGYFTSIMQPLVSIVFIFVVMLLVNSSYVVVYAKRKKNLLRISLIFLVIMLVLSLFGRVREFIVDVTCWLCILNTILYIVLVVFNVSILKDLYRLVHDLFR
jgi:hypothetical protein